MISVVFLKETLRASDILGELSVLAPSADNGSRSKLCDKGDYGVFAGLRGDSVKLWAVQKQPCVLMSLSFPLTVHRGSPGRHWDIPASDLCPPHSPAHHCTSDPDVRRQLAVPRLLGGGSPWEGGLAVPR